MPILIIMTAIAVVFSFYNYMDQATRTNLAQRAQANIGQFVPDEMKQPTKSAFPNRQIETTPTKTTAVTPKATAKTTVSKPKAIAQVTPIQPKVWVDTFIISGPTEGEVINKANQVTFEFKGLIYPEGKTEGIYFETKLLGVDKDWKTINTTKRTIVLPNESKAYTFLVRARTIKITDQTPSQRTFNLAVSPYFSKLKISSISSTQIVLASKIQDENQIDITGWKVVSQKGTITIPKGTALFLPGQSTKDQDDIFIKKNDRIYLESASNPFKVVTNFKPNKCFGYLKDSYGSSFPSSLQTTRICPKVDKNSICNYSQDCITNILKLEKCQAVNYSKNLNIMFDTNCRTFIDNYIVENLKYEGCVENYYKDKDFFKSEWRIYIGYSISCNCNDIIYLYDKNGLLVDKYNYQVYR